MRVHFKDLAEEQQHRIRLFLKNQLSFRVVYIFLPEFLEEQNKINTAHIHINQVVERVLSANPIHINEFGLHNLAGPAIDSLGVRIWCTYGQLHNPDGFAIEGDASERSVPGKKYQRWAVRESYYFLHGVVVPEFNEILIKKTPINMATWCISYLKKRYSRSVLRKAIAHIRRTLRHEGLSDEQIRVMIAGIQFL